MRDENKIRNTTGKLEFYVQETSNRKLVCDRTGKALGFCDDNNTYKVTGEKIALGSQPALLAKEKPKR